MAERQLDSGRIVRGSCRSGRCDSAVVKRSRRRSSRDWGVPWFTELALLVRVRSLRVLRLNRHRRNMSLTCRSLFFRSRTRMIPPLPPL